MEAVQSRTILVTNKGHQLQRCGAYSIAPGQTIRVPASFLAGYATVFGLRFDFSEWGEKLETYTPDGKFTFDFWAPLSGLDGYGRHAVDIYRGFLQAGAAPILRDVGWAPNEFLDDDIRQAKTENYYKVPKKIGLSFTVGYDPRLWDHGSVLKVALTQFESTHVPPAHIAAVNKTNHLIVTSRFGEELYRDCGTRVPISVMIPGIDTERFAYRKRKKDGKFKVLIVGALTGRKNPIGAIRIFKAASEGNPDWRLTIKSRNAKGIKAAYAHIRNDSRITLLIEDTPPSALLEYYYRHDCFLFPTKSEGVGLPVLEAMSTGMEVVSTYNTGLADFVLPETAWQIEGMGMESAQGDDGFSDEYVDAYGSVGQWFLPDERSGARQLAKAYEAWLEDRGKGDYAARYIRENHTLLHQADSIIPVLEQYV